MPHNNNFIQFHLQLISSSFVMQTTWWDFLCFKHKYDNFRLCLKGIVFILRCHILCRMFGMCAITYILIWDFHLTPLHKTHFMILKNSIYVLNASAFSIIFSLSSPEDGEGDTLQIFINIRGIYLKFSYFRFWLNSVHEMKSKFFIKYLTSCRNAHIIAYHGLFPFMQILVKEQRGEKRFRIDFISLLCAKNWIIIESHWGTEERFTFGNHNRMNSFMFYAHPRGSVRWNRNISVMTLEKEWRSRKIP